MLNTLRYANALKNAGVGAEQAEAMAEALDTEMTGEIASKADITELKADIREVKADVRELATSTKADIDRLDTKIDHLDEKLTMAVSPRIDGLDKRIDDLKITTGVAIALATLVLTAVQVYFGLR